MGGPLAVPVASAGHAHLEVGGGAAQGGAVLPPAADIPERGWERAASPTARGWAAAGCRVGGCAATVGRGSRPRGGCAAGARGYGSAGHGGWHRAVPAGLGGPDHALGGQLQSPARAGRVDDHTARATGRGDGPQRIRRASGSGRPLEVWRPVWWWTPWCRCSRPLISPCGFALW